MALKKPSDFFEKNIKEDLIPEVTSDNSLYEELNKVENLSEQISQLQKELSQKLVKNDLEIIVLNQIKEMQEKFSVLQNELKRENKKDIEEFKNNAFEISELVNNLILKEIPKYRKKVTKNELYVQEKIEQVKDLFEENIIDIKNDIDYKLNNIAEVVDNNIDYFDKKLQETSSKVKKTTETYNNISKILENKILNENEKLEEYSEIIKNLEKSFFDFSLVLKEDLSVSLDNTNKKVDQYRKELEKVETSVDNTLEDYRKELIDVKTNVVINEQHIKNIDNFLERNHSELVQLKEEVFLEIEKIPVGNFQENLERIERKIDYIKETYSKIEPEEIVNEVISEGLLNDPPETKNTDPLTPLNQNFVTLEQLQEHYRLFINRIQQQLSTIGGGGETRLKYLDDIVGIATNPSAYNGKYLKYDHSLGKFIFDESGLPEIQNVLYVNKNGNDSNSGKTSSKAKLTIKSAVSSASEGTIIKVSAGTYFEDNPITLPNQISIVGDSLREVTIIPLNVNSDLFYVGDGNYISQMSFKGSLNGKSIVSFDPVNSRYITQSPYIQNCTNFISNSIGMKIDGSKALGQLKSMVLDSYTQYNQNGIGVSITNEGYAQLVSLFTICNDVAVYCASGAACDLTNSNSSFGNYGLIADGVGPQKYTGIVTVTSSENSDTFVIDLNTPTLNVTNAVYDNTTGLTTVTVNNNHNFNVGVAVTISGLQFTCPSGPGIVTYPSGNNGYIFRVSSIPTSNSFEVYVGISTLPHTYSSGGTVKINIVRPFDGQAIYFNELFYTVKRINITNGGSGYTSPPEIIIDSPTVEWGVQAQAIANVENGVVTSIDMISSGRGYQTIPNVTIGSGINTAVVIAEITPEYYTIQKSTEPTNGVCIITTNENVPFVVGIGTQVKFFKQSRILATGHSFEFIGSGTDIVTSLPFNGGVANTDNETDSRNGGLVVYTSTNHSGNFKIGDGLVINQNTGSISGTAYTKSLFSTMTPYILSLGGF